MIPEAFITEWSRQAPWPTDTQIEHDLILSRLTVEIANNPVLGPEFAMRGGTCLHKLHLPEPYRYSEDLDYVRRTHSGIKPYMDALRSIVTGVGLIEHGYQQVGQMVHMIFDAEPTSGVGRIRVKIETNVREVESFGERRDHPFSVQSSWWQGKAEIPTFSLEELMGTKLRACTSDARAVISSTSGSRCTTNRSLATASLGLSTITWVRRHSASVTSPTTSSTN